MEYFKALLAGDKGRALSFLSSKFGVSSGLACDDHIRYELQQFEERGHLLRGGIEIRRLRFNGLVDVYGVFSEGRFVYEDEFWFDENDLLMGNGRPCDIVSKIHRYHDGRTTRAVAIRYPDIKHLRCLDPAVREQRFIPKANADAAQLFLSLGDDDGRSRIMDFRVLKEGFAGPLAAEMRGKDHPLFVDDMFPLIRGCEVEVAPERMSIWSLMVWFADGRTQVINAPQKKHYRFPDPVVQAVLTDALDNDWDVTV